VRIALCKAWSNSGLVGRRRGRVGTSEARAWPVGAGGGRPPPATRWARRNPRPYRDHRGSGPGKRLACPSPTSTRRAYAEPSADMFTPDAPPNHQRRRATATPNKNAINSELRGASRAILLKMLNGIPGFRPASIASLTRWTVPFTASETSVMVDFGSGTGSKPS
jgi:hypothetical protein